MMSHGFQQETKNLLLLYGAREHKSHLEIKKKLFRPKKVGVLVVRVRLYMYHKMEEKERRKGRVLGLA